MTSNDQTADQIIESGVTEARKLLENLERSRNDQPAKLADMRARADAERAKARADEPWLDTVEALPTYSDGDLTGMMGLPSLDGKAIWGARLAFDLVSREAPAKAVIAEYFSDIRDLDHLMVVLAEACTTLAECIVAPLLEVAEIQGGDYDLRPRLADAARNAWSVRCANVAETMRDTDDEGGE